MLKHFFPLLFFVLLIGFIFWYNKEEFTASPNANPEFTTNTLSFDTVFTSLTSASKQFKVMKPNNQAVNISLVRKSVNILCFNHICKRDIVVLHDLWSSHR